jgi:O-antigen/teichoic acid export membrane protein
MYWETLLLTLQQIFSVVGVLFVVYYLDGGPVLIFTVFLITAAVKTIIAYTVVHKKLFKLSIKCGSKDQIHQYFSESWPIALQDSLRQGNIRIGILLLGIMSNHTQVAYFAAPFRILVRVRILMFSLIRPLLPEFSRQAILNRQVLARYFEVASRWMILIGTFITGILWFFSEYIVLLILGDDFKGAVIPFKIMTLFIPFIFFIFLSLYVLYACNSQQHALKNSLAGLMTNIILILLLIPKFQATGAAVAFVVSCIVISALHLRLICRILPLPRFIIGQWPLPVSIILGFICFYFFRSLPQAFSLGTSMSIFVGFLFYSGYVCLSDLRFKH